jgi:hypothetical protein
VENDLISNFSTKIAKKNFLLGVINGVLFVTFDTFFEPTLVMVSFLSHYTQSNALLGLLVPLRDVFWTLPQLWVSGNIQNKPFKIQFYKMVSFFRITAWGLIVLVVLFIHEPFWILTGFFLTFTLSSLANGMAGLPFLEVVSKTIHPKRRAEFFAWRLGIGGLGGVAASFLVKYLLSSNSPISFPNNYGLLAFLLFVGCGISLLVFNGVQEPVDQVFQPKATFSQQFRRGMIVIKTNTNYRYFILMQACLMLAGSGLPFFAIFAQKEFGIDPSMLGIYLGIMTGVNLFSNAVLGRLSSKVGNKTIMVISTIIGLSLSLMLLFLSAFGHNYHFSAYFIAMFLIPIYILYSIRGTGLNISGNALLLDISPGEDRSLYIGFTNTLLGLITIFNGLSGFLVDWFGFSSLFCLITVMHLAALLAGTKIRSSAC